MMTSKIPPILLLINSFIIPIIGIITNFLVPHSYNPLIFHFILSSLIFVSYVGTLKYDFFKKNINYLFHASLFILMLWLTWLNYKNNYAYAFVTNFQVSYIIIGITYRNIWHVLIFVLILLAFNSLLHYSSVNPIVPFYTMFPSMILLSAIMTFASYVLIKKDLELAMAYEEKDKILTSLKDSEKNLMAIFASSQQAFLLLNNDLNTQLFNHTAEVFAQQIIGIDLKLGTSVFHYVLEKYMPQGEEMLFNARDKGISSSSIGVYKLKNNKYAWVEYHVNPVFSDGKIVGVFVNIQDITKVKSVELELRASNDELRQFAYIVSHDLKEPLRVINSFSQLLQRQLKDKTDKNVTLYLEFITNGAKRMHLLLNDLMSYVTLSKAEETKETIDLNLVMDTVTQNLKLYIEEANAQIHYHNLPHIQANQGQMIHLFQNLISNAIKFQQKDKTPIIDITHIQTRNTFEIRIKDNGIGIATEHQDKIFEIFKRLHTQEEYKGTGIGLSISKKIVRQLGGNISVTSEINQGSTFTVSFPIEQHSIEYQSITTI